jgi:hypothetical protein
VNVAIVTSAIAVPVCLLLGWLAWLRFLRKLASNHGPDAARQLAISAGTGFQTAFRPNRWPSLAARRDTSRSRRPRAGGG